MTQKGDLWHATGWALACYLTGSLGVKLIFVQCHQRLVVLAGADIWPYLRVFKINGEKKGDDDDDDDDGGAMDASSGEHRVINHSSCHVWIFDHVLFDKQRDGEPASASGGRRIMLRSAVRPGSRGEARTRVPGSGGARRRVRSFVYTLYDNKSNEYSRVKTLLL